MYYHVCLVLIQATICMSAEKTKSASKVVRDSFSGAVGETYQLNTSNYMNAKPHLTGYNMSQLLIHVYKFSNTDTTGAVRVQFVEYDLHNKSSVRIYDGANTLSNGSLWVHNTTSPVYASTGPHLTILFKTGVIDKENSHFGFIANVSYVSETNRTLWEDLPSTGFCPEMKDIEGEGYGVFSYRTQTLNLPVYCSYQIRSTVKPYLAIASEHRSIMNDSQLIVRDSLSGGSIIYPFYTEMAETVHSEDVVLLMYNLTHAKQGFHIRLEPNITNGYDKIFVTYHRGPNWRLAKDIALKVENLDLPRYKMCPYKTCDLGYDVKCKLYWEPCLTESYPEKDSTCDLVRAYREQRYKMCEYTAHCYNEELDRCDGYQDCGGYMETDEAGCKPKPDHLGVPWYGFLIIAIVAIAIAFVIVIILTRPSVRTKLATCCPTTSHSSRYHVDGGSNSSTNQ